LLKGAENRWLADGVFEGGGGDGSGGGEEAEGVWEGKTAAAAVEKHERRGHLWDVCYKMCREYKQQQKNEIYQDHVHSASLSRFHRFVSFLFLRWEGA
jgi:hypothetical protein